MYQFRIVKAKYTRRTRWWLAILGVVAFFCLPAPVILMLNYYEVSGMGTIMIPIVMTVFVFIPVYQKIIDKTFVKGYLDWHDDRVMIRLRSFSKEIMLEDIREVRMLPGTGSGKFLRTTTLVMKIKKYGGESICIHATRETYPNGKRLGRYVWNDNPDILSLLERANISFEIDFALKEKECLV